MEAIIEEKTSAGLQAAGQIAGLAYGLYFAHKRGSGFLGYVGWAIYWGIVFRGAGKIIDYTIQAIKK